MVFLLFLLLLFLSLLLHVLAPHGLIRRHAGADGTYQSEDGAYVIDLPNGALSTDQFRGKTDVIVTFGGTMFSVMPLAIEDWAVIIAATSVVLWAGELRRLLFPRREAAA